MGKTITVDFSKVQDTSKPVDKGTYHVLVKKFEYTPKTEEERKAKMKEGKWPYFNTQAEITEGPFAGRRLFCNLTTNPEETQNGSAKNFMLCGFLVALGLATPGQKDLDIDPEAPLNQHMVWEVDIEPAKGTEGEDNYQPERNQVKKFFPA